MKQGGFFAICYDISDDRRRGRVAKILEDYGDRVQYSVFEVILDTEARLAKLKRRLQKVIDPEVDSVRIYALCEGCRKKVEVMGTGSVLEDADYYVV